MKPISLFFCLCLWATASFSQIVPLVTSSVDTAQKEINAVYHLYKNYLNAHPDSAYNNPYWNKEEQPGINKKYPVPSDRFFWANYRVKFSSKYYKFTILSIDKLYNNADTYRIRTLINYQPEL